MADTSRNIVYIDPDLLDLVPVLVDSLSAELEEMVSCAEKRDFANFRDKIHSSKGAALTFGFEDYAQELGTLRGAAINQDNGELLQSLGRLKVLLKETSFLPAG
ncbi:hypothetical protein D0S45_11485 [Marinifilum sp. JC120]|nr:hypothetical protein D0S45_11485 [Marinifilum sp. JC120]